ncbi:MAG TPA: hypothetical protein DCF68_05380 [Cyanothece sp. UBA12306]|nr:hypothetical protein [Cyanothece sp. UBA12306]
MNSPNGDRSFLEHLDKILFGVAGTYFILVLLWLVSQNGLFSSSQSSKPSKQPLSSEDAQFIAYLQQSLNLIKKPPEPQTVINRANLSNSPAKNIEIPAPAPAPPKVIERVYIPVSPLQQPAQTPVPTTNSPLPSTPVPVSRIPSPPPLSASPPTKVPVFTPGQTLPSLPQKTASTSVPNANLGHGLVGVLESGDRSSAIFTYNGTSRRFSVGEFIGSSGWMLMGVEQQKAIISRNGQTRYLEVGQTF